MVQREDDSEYEQQVPEGVLIDDPSRVPDVAEDIGRETDEKDSDAQDFAMTFLAKVIRLRGVKIDRADFLRQELRKLGMSEVSIAAAIETTPLHAGAGLAQLDVLADASIRFETTKSAALSFATGLPGGFALFATIPGDITQYYVHAFRVMQKLAYLYGWKDFLGDLDDVDDETVGRLAMFLGVMMGVGGTANALSAFAHQVARPALQKQIAQKALTKTVWYGPVKRTLRMIGIKLTKDSLAKSVTKAVPVAGGVISGGMTLISLRSQSQRLRDQLRVLPPPGTDAAEFELALRDVEDKKGREPSEDKRARAGQVVAGASSAIKGAADGVGPAAGAAVGKTKDGVSAWLGGARRLRRRVGEPSSSADGEPGGVPGDDVNPSTD